jgi:DNA-binding transcriptional ArsR family regulator
MERRIELTDPRLIKALAHPMRTRILGMLDGRVASPRELSDEVDVSLQTLSYHVRMLAKLGLIELVRTGQRRGAIEHYYTAVAAPRVAGGAWAGLSPIVRERLAAAGLSEIVQQVSDAAAGGGFAASDARLSSIELVLDEEGRRALRDELAATVERVDRIQAEARRRLGNDHDAEQRMALVMLRFDDPRKA